MKLTIAIDGPASSGKGTAARHAARILDYAYIDTGAMYRTVALLAIEQGIPLDDGPKVGQLAGSIDFGFRWDGDVLRISANGRDVSSFIRTEEIGMGASNVGVLPEVRAALLNQQRALGASGGVVMDGRDIGTVVLPNADLKVFLDATPEERARRRHLELQAKGINKEAAQVLREIKERDHQDRTRKVAPLRQAADAIAVDSTHLSIEEMGQQIVNQALQRLDAAQRND